MTINKISNVKLMLSLQKIYWGKVFPIVLSNTLYDVKICYGSNNYCNPTCNCKYIATLVQSTINNHHSRSMFCANTLAIYGGLKYGLFSGNKCSSGNVIVSCCNCVTMSALFDIIYDNKPSMIINSNCCKSEKKCSESYESILDNDIIVGSIKVMGIMHPIKSLNYIGDNMNALLRTNMCPSNIITKKALENATIYGVSLCGSMAVFEFILKIADVFKVDFGISDINKYKLNVPMIGINDIYQCTDILPLKLVMECAYFNKDIPTVTGRTLYEDLLIDS